MKNDIANWFLSRHARNVADSAIPLEEFIDRLNQDPRFRQDLQYGDGGIAWTLERYPDQFSQYKTTSESLTASDYHTLVDAFAGADLIDNFDPRHFAFSVLGDGEPGNRIAQQATKMPKFLGMAKDFLATGELVSNISDEAISSNEMTRNSLFADAVGQVFVQQAGSDGFKERVSKLLSSLGGDHKKQLLNSMIVAAITKRLNPDELASFIEVASPLDGDLFNEKAIQASPVAFKVLNRISFEKTTSVLNRIVDASLSKSNDHRPGQEVVLSILKKTGHLLNFDQAKEIVEKISDMSELEYSKKAIEAITSYRSTAMKRSRRTN